MPVNNQCEEYQKKYPQWVIVRDCVEGELEIKGKGEKYLPRPSGQSNSDYCSYKERARFFDGTSRTAEGFHGHIFAKAPVQSDKISDSTKKYLGDVDASGNAINEFASDIVWDAMQTNWGGILVDHTPVEQGTHQNEATGRAYLKWYPAETVINWQYAVINGVKKLSKIVLREDIEEEMPDDEFEIKKTEAYRVLSFNEKGEYIQRVYIKDDKSITGFSLARTIDDIKINGKPLDSIPFFTCPGETPEKSMLLGLSFENIGFYQRSADLENGLHLIGIPTPVAENMETPVKITEDRDGNITTEKEIINFGGTKFLFFCQRDENGNITGDVRVKFLEFSGAGLEQIAQANNDCLVRMAKIGIQAIGPERKGVETAEAAQLKHAAEFGVLGAFSRSMSDKITAAVRLMMIWNMLPEEEVNEWIYQLNYQFNIEEASAQILQIMFSARQAGELPRQVWFNALKQSGKLPEEMTFEDFLEEIHTDETGGHGVDGDEE